MPARRGELTARLTIRKIASGPGPKPPAGGRNRACAGPFRTRLARSQCAVSSLIASNATFGAMLFSDLSNKLSAISQRQSQHELRSLTMARVDEAFGQVPKTQ